MSKKQGKKPIDSLEQYKAMTSDLRAQLDRIDRIVAVGENAKKAAKKSPAKPVAVKAPKLVSRVLMACVAAAALVAGLILGLMFH